LKLSRHTVVRLSFPRATTTATTTMTFSTTLPQVASGPTASTISCSGPLLHCLSFSILSQLLTARVGFVLSLVVILAAQYLNSPWRKIPPGPKGLPILGNALQFKDKRWMFEKDCKRKFGVYSSSHADSTLQTDQRGHRKYHVSECLWQAHGCFK